MTHGDRPAALATIDDVLAGRARFCVAEAHDSLSTLGAMPSDCCAALITDPPYSSGGLHMTGRMQTTTKKYVGSSVKNPRPAFTGDNRNERSFRYWETLWLSEATRVCASGAPGLVFTDWRQLPTTTDALQAGGWLWRGVVAWDKTHARPQLGRFRHQCEYIVWGSNGPMPRAAGVGALPGAFRVPVGRIDKHHQTAKPVDLMRALVRVVPPDGIVLDPFCGSGSTGVGAVREGRRFIGIERDAGFVDIARRRIAAAMDNECIERKQAA